MAFEETLRGLGRDAARLIADRDWSATSLGPMEAWPACLRCVLTSLLLSPVPMVMLWGEDGVMLYNDAYSEFAGARHPELLGSKVREGWPEVADFNDNVMRVGLAGQTLQYRDQELTLFRNGQAEKVWLNLDYSPILGEDDKPAGVMAIVLDTTGRVMAEEALKRERDRARSVLDNMGEALVLLDREFRLVDANAEAQKLDPRPAESYLGKTHWEAHPEAAPELGELFRKAMSAREPGELQHRYVWPDGRSTWIQMRAFPVDPGLAVFYKDVTETRVAEEALRESEARFRNMADHSPVMLWVTDPTGYCVYLNRGWYAFTGQTPGEAEGYGWLDATHPDDRPSAEKAFIEANTAQVPFRIEYRLRRADGTWRWCIDTAAPRFGPGGEYLGYIGSVIDIDERREAEDRQRESEARLRTVTNSVPVFVWFATPDGELHYFNDRWYEYTGQTPDEAVPNGWADVVHPEDMPKVAQAWAAAREAGTHYEMELRLRRHDGAWRWYMSRAEPIFGPDGGITAWIGSSSDIHERVTAEDHQRLLINELNHRVKNTLATVQALASQSATGAQSPQAFREVFEGRLLSLSAAHDLLTATNWEGAGLAEVVRRALGPWAQGDRLTASGPALWLSPRQALSISMALHELSTNAAKYGALSGHGGQVEITWSVEGETARLSWRERGGPAVAAPKTRGFGSRLLERGISRELGGKVSLRFEPQGVECDIELPVAVAAAQAPLELQPKSTPAL